MSSVLSYVHVIPVLFNLFINNFEFYTFMRTNYSAIKHSEQKTNTDKIKTYQFTPSTTLTTM